MVRKKEPFLNAIGGPGPAVLPLLKINLARSSPCQERLTNRREVQRIDDWWKCSEPGFDAPPRFAATLDQALATCVAPEGFSGCCFRNRHLGKAN